MKSFNDLVAKVTGLGGDVSKTDEGNKTAGIRVRAGMQEIKALADQVRKDVLDLRDGVNG